MAIRITVRGTAYTNAPPVALRCYEKQKRVMYGETKGGRGGGGAAGVSGVRVWRDEEEAGRVSGRLQMSTLQKIELKLAENRTYQDGGRPLAPP